MSYITPNELINYKLYADATGINTKRLQDLIDTDRKSPHKVKMREGIRYFNKEHDILNYVRTYWHEGKEVPDKVKTNRKLIHPFHQLAVNRKTAYICSKPVKVTTKEPDIVDPDKPTAEESKQLKDAQDFQNYLGEYLNDDFNQMLYDTVEDISNGGFAVWKMNVNPDEELEFILIPAKECAPIYDMQHQNKLIGMLRYYKFPFVNSSTGKMKELYKVEYYTDNNVTYWEQQEDESFVSDYSYNTNTNVFGHFEKWNTTKPGEVQQLGWGRVPFVIIKNNSKCTTDLDNIKTLIDAYDLVVSGFCNDLLDFDKLVYVIKNFMGLIGKPGDLQAGISEIAMAVKNIHEHGLILTDDKGGADTIKAEIPVEAKKEFLKMTREAIFYLGEDVDTSSESFINAPSGWAIELRYVPLDQKADRTISQVKLALKDFYWFVTKFINMKYKKNFDSAGIVTTFNKTIITNKLEMVQLLAQSNISQQTYLENHPLINSAEDELKRMDRERNQAVENVNLDDVEIEDEEMQQIADANVPTKLQT